MNKKIKQSLLSLFVFFSFLPKATALPTGEEDADNVFLTHRFITDKATERFFYEENEQSENDLEIYRQRIIQGSFEADDGLHFPARDHFFNPDTGAGMSLGIPAPERAYYLWNDLIDKYKKGRKYEAYYSLGIIAHLLEDMSVPAHTIDGLFEHGINDQYEHYCETTSNSIAEDMFSNTPYSTNDPSNLTNYFSDIESFKKFFRYVAYASYEMLPATGTYGRYLNITIDGIKGDKIHSIIVHNYEAGGDHRPGCVAKSDFSQLGDVDEDVLYQDLITNGYITENFSWDGLISGIILPKFIALTNYEEMILNVYTDKKEQIYNILKDTSLECEKMVNFLFPYATAYVVKLLEIFNINKPDVEVQDYLDEIGSSWMNEQGQMIISTTPNDEVKLSLDFYNPGDSLSLKVSSAEIYYYNQNYEKIKLAEISDTTLEELSPGGKISKSSITPDNKLYFTVPNTNLMLGYHIWAEWQIEIRYQGNPNPIIRSGNTSLAVFSSPDTTPPIISNVNASSITSTSAVISWQTDELSTSQVAYGTSTSCGLSTPIYDEVNKVTAHSVTVTSLSPNATYHYRVISKDVAGNPKIGEDYTFFTTTDTTKPEISNAGIANLTSNSVIVNWMTNEPASSQVEYGQITNYGVSSPIDTSLAINHSVYIEGLTPNTTYHYRVKSMDAAGNLSESGDYSFVAAELSGIDLFISSLDLSDSNIIEGENVKLSVQLHNIGYRDFQQKTQVAFYCDGSIINDIQEAGPILAEGFKFSIRAEGSWISASGYRKYNTPNVDLSFSPWDRGPKEEHYTIEPDNPLDVLQRGSYDPEEIDEYNVTVIEDTFREVYLQRVEGFVKAKLRKWWKGNGRYFHKFSASFYKGYPWEKTIDNGIASINTSEPKRLLDLRLLFNVSYPPIIVSKYHSESFQINDDIFVDDDKDGIIQGHGVVVWVDGPWLWAMRGTYVASEKKFIPGTSIPLNVANVIWTAQVGNHSLKALVDPNRIINEYPRYNNSYTTQVTVKQNTFPPQKPTLSGPALGVISRTYTFTASSSDPEGQKIKFVFKWGDETSHETAYLDYSGDLKVTGALSHAWNGAGNYNVTVQAIDESGKASDWSNPLSVTIYDPPSGWSSDENLTQHEGNSILPCIVSEGGNNVYMVWQDSYKVWNAQKNIYDWYGEIYFKKSSDGGISWTSAVGLAGVSDANPKLAVDGNGYLHLVYGANGALMYRRSTDKGATWGSYVTLAPKFSRKPAICASGSNIYVAWEDCSRNSGQGFREISFKKSVNGGNNWSNKLSVSPMSVISNNPTIASDGQNVYLAWYYKSGGSGIGLFNKSSDGGNTWGPVSGLGFIFSPIYEAMITPQMILDPAKNLHLTWANRVEGGIYYARSVDQANSWSAQRLILAEGAGFPDIISDDSGGIHIVWTDKHLDKNYEVYYKESLDNGNIWQPESRLTFADKDSTNPSVAVTPQAVHIAWQDNRSGNNEIYYIRHVAPKLFSLTNVSCTPNPELATALLDVPGYDQDTSAHQDILPDKLWISFKLHNKVYRQHKITVEIFTRNGLTLVKRLVVEQPESLDIDPSGGYSSYFSNYAMWDGQSDVEFPDPYGQPWCGYVPPLLMWKIKITAQEIDDNGNPGKTTTNWTDWFGWDAGHNKIVPKQYLAIDANGSKKGLRAEYSNGIVISGEGPINHGVGGLPGHVPPIGAYDEPCYYQGMPDYWAKKWDVFGIFSEKLTGYIYAPETGVYKFKMVVDDYAALVVNGWVICTYDNIEAPGETFGEIPLEGGKWYPIYMEYANRKGSNGLGLYWNVAVNQNFIFTDPTFIQASGKDIKAFNEFITGESLRPGINE